MAGALLLAVATVACTLAVASGGSVDIVLVDGRVSDEDGFGAGGTDAFVKLRVGSSGFAQSPAKRDNNSPTWNWATSWTGISVGTLARFEVWDADSFLTGSDDRFASSSFTIQSGTNVATRVNCCGGHINFRTTFTPTDACTSFPCGSDSACTFRGDNLYSCRCNAGYYSPAGSTPSGTGCIECPPGYACPAGALVQCSQSTSYQDSFRATSCKTTRPPCAATQYESTTPTTTQNRVCAALQVCLGTEFESRAPSTTSDRQCTVIDVCNKQTEYQDRAPTPTSDRVCNRLRTCSAAEFQTVAPTLTSNRACQLLTVCLGEYASVPATPTSDRSCTAYTLPCFLPDFYESVPPTPTSDRTCAAVTNCTALEYRVRPPTPVSDRVCAKRTGVCKPGTFEFNLEGADRQCFSCPRGFADLDNVSLTPCVACGIGTSSSQEGATSCPACPPGTSDVDGNAATPCVPCPAGTYTGAQHTGACTLCAAGSIDSDSQPSTPCLPCSLPGIFVPEGSSGACVTAPYACQTGTTDADSNSSTPCVSCDEGHFLPVASEGPCRSFRCPAGQSDVDRDPSTVCVACPAGTYAAVGSAGPCEAKACPPGAVDDDSDSMTACVACPAGTFAGMAGLVGPCSGYACPAGTFDDDGQADTPCKPCGFGTFDDDQDPTTACKACPVGTFSTPMSTLCIEAPPGFHDSDSDPATPFVECPLGTFTEAGRAGPCPRCVGPTADLDEDPSTPCEACPAGTFQDQDGQTKCTPCTTSCQAEFWLDGPCTSTEDAVCRLCTGCGLNEFRTAACAATANDLCLACTVCEEYESDCTRLADSVCVTRASRSGLGGETASVVIPVVVVVAVAALFLGLILAARNRRKEPSAPASVAPMFAMTAEGAAASRCNSAGYLDIAPDESEHLYNHLGKGGSSAGAQTYDTLDRSTGITENSAYVSADREESYAALQKTNPAYEPMAPDNSPTYEPVAPDHAPAFEPVATDAGMYTNPMYRGTADEGSTYNTLSAAAGTSTSTDSPQNYARLAPRPASASSTAPTSSGYEVPAGFNA